MAPAGEQGVRESRWRVSTAICSMNSYSSASNKEANLSCEFSSESRENWESLTTYISAMESTDSGFKADTLHQLSLFLLCVAPTSEALFQCPDAHTISIQLVNKDVSFRLQDVYVLHNLLVGELTKATSCLFRPNFNARDPQYDNNYVSLLVEVLRCCIRMLPLLEYNMGLSLVASQTLSVILKRLCCPTNLHLLSGGNVDPKARVFDTLDFLHEVGRGEVELSNLGTPWICSMEASIKHLQECLLRDTCADFVCRGSQKNVSVWGKTGKTCSEANGTEVACSLLEVFMDELLLQPTLVDMFWDSERPLSSNDGGSSHQKHVRLICEVAASHFFLSASRSSYLESLSGMANSMSFYSGMSLPAVVMLFDLSVLNASCLPGMFLVNIMHMLRRLLESAICLNSELPPEMVLSLAASVLESATRFYSALHTPSCLALKCKESEFGSLLDSSFDMFANAFAKFHSGNNLNVGSVWETLLTKIEYLKSECILSWDGSSMPEFSSSFMCSSSRHGHLFSCTALVVSTLQLISSSLMLLVGEANKSIASLGAGPGNNTLHGNATLYIDHVKQVFRFCDLQDWENVISKLKLDFPFLELFRKADDEIEHAFTFFIERLYVGFKHGNAKALQKAYWDILMSLISLFSFPNLRWKASQGGFDDSRRKVSQGAILHKTCPYDLRSKSTKNEQKLQKEGVSRSQHVTEMSSSTILLTKKYQHKRNKILLFKRPSQSPTQEELISKRDNTDTSLGLEQNHGVERQKSCRMDGDSYIADMLKIEGNIDGQWGDLKDFIVCKDGRDYSMWLKSRYLKRERKHRRSYWKRLKARKVLVSLLSSHSKSHEIF